MDENDDVHRYGRAGFLGVVGAGLTSLVWGTRASGIFSPVTSAFSQAIGNLLPVGGWRIYTISGSMPVFDPQSWRLEIGGLVRRPLSLDYDALRRLPRAEQVSTFHCVTGWTVDNVHWAGVRFADAPRLYRVPMSVSISTPLGTEKREAVIVLARRGIARIQAEGEQVAAAGPAEAELPELDDVPELVPQS